MWWTERLRMFLTRKQNNFANYGYNWFNLITTLKNPSGDLPQRSTKLTIGNTE